MKYKAIFATSLFSRLILAPITQYSPQEAESTQRSCAFPTLLGTAARLGSVGGPAQPAGDRSSRAQGEAVR